MRTILNNKRIAWQLLLSLAAAASAALYTGCKEDDELGVPGKTKPLAAPKDLSSKVRGTTVTLAWRGNLETKAYEVELTRAENGDEVASAETAKPEYTVEELRVKTDYTVRVRALAENAQYHSPWAEHTFKSGDENIMKAAAREIRDTLVAVSWLAEQEVTHFIAYPQDDPDNTLRFDITPEEKLSGEKSLGGLWPETTYEVELYNVDYIRGSAAFTTLPQAYHPLAVTAAAVAPQGITLSWTADEHVTHFTFTPANLAGVNRVNVASSTSTTVLAANLKPNTAYTFTAFMNNSHRGESTFTTSEPEQDLTVTATPLTSRTVQLAWNAAVDSVVTRVRWNLTDSTYSFRNITAAERTAGSAVVEGLTPNTAYTFMLQAAYDSVYDRGFATATTLPKPPGITNVPAGDSIHLYLADAVSGDTLMLMGAEYSTATLLFDKTITIMGNPGGAQVKISVTSSEGFRLPTTPGVSLVFVNCNIYRSDPSNNDSHTFNFNGNGLASKIAFVNCRVADFGRNLMRARNDTNYDTLYIDNCIFENMGVTGGNYGFVHLENNAVVKNIIIKNSTFNKNGCHFINVNTATAGIEKIDIQNSTFYQMLMTSNNRSFINANQAAVAVTLKRLILGSTSSVQTTTAGYSNPNGTETVEDVYQTDSWVLTTNVPNTTPYTGTAADLFVDPDNGDFHIKDGSFAGAATAGDPRWR